MNNNYEIHLLNREKDETIIPGKKIADYKSNIMLSPGKVVTVNNKKYKVRCIDLLPNGTRKVLVE